MQRFDHGNSRPSPHSVNVRSHRDGTVSRGSHDVALTWHVLIEIVTAQGVDASARR